MQKIVSFFEAMPSGLPKKYFCDVKIVIFSEINLKNTEKFEFSAKNLENRGFWQELF